MRRHNKAQPRLRVTVKEQSCEQFCRYIAKSSAASRRWVDAGFRFSFFTAQQVARCPPPAPPRPPQLPHGARRVGLSHVLIRWICTPPASLSRSCGPVGPRAADRVPRPCAACGIPTLGRAVAAHPLVRRTTIPRRARAGVALPCGGRILLATTTATAARGLRIDGEGVRGAACLAAEVRSPGSE